MRKFIVFLFCAFSAFLYAQETYQYRYWFDTFDTAAQLGTADNHAFHLDIDASALAVGLHTFNYQIVDDTKGASVTKIALFYKEAFTGTTGHTYRYWFDTADEAAKTAMSTNNVLTLDVDATALSIGSHTFNFQIIDAEGGVSTTKAALFYKMLVSSNTQIVVLIDGNITDAYDARQISDSLIYLDVDASLLPLGIHTLTLQLADNAGVVSSIAQSLFMKVASNEDLSDLILYYYVDNQKQEQIPCALVDGVMHADLDMSALEDGTHSITFVVANAQGVTLQAKTAYFLKESGSVTQLEDIRMDELSDDAVLYDILGRKLYGKPEQTGVYILNGKKVFVH